MNEINVHETKNSLWDYEFPMFCLFHFSPFLFKLMMSWPDLPTISLLKRHCRETDANIFP